MWHRHRTSCGGRWTDSLQHQDGLWQVQATTEETAISESAWALVMVIHAQAHSRWWYVPVSKTLTKHFLFWRCTQYIHHRHQPHHARVCRNRIVHTFQRNGAPHSSVLASRPESQAWKQPKSKLNLDYFWRHGSPSTVLFSYRAVTSAHTRSLHVMWTQEPSNLSYKSKHYLIKTMLSSRELKDSGIFLFRF